MRNSDLSQVFGSCVIEHASFRFLVSELISVYKRET